ncbi:MAG: hypothetical protein FWD36_09845, partial [Treponema sp.]|nr:hypothetical protein [Treponema sp.]
QIIESKKLSESENLWLKSLRNDLEIRNADGILKETKQWQGKMPLDAYFDILLRANRDTFLEVLDMKTAPTLESILTEAGLLPKWIAQGKAEGKAEGEAKGKAEVARNLFAMQMPIEMIAQAVQMPVEEVHALASG